MNPLDNEVVAQQVQFTLPRVLLTEEEAARALALSPRTLWQLRHDGDLPFVAIGRSIRYRPSDLQEWVARQLAQQSDRRNQKLRQTPSNRG